MLRRKAQYVKYMITIDWSCCFRIDL